jgi:transposase
MVNARLWLHATGAQWRDLTERYGPWQSVATRFYRWVAAGVWDTLLATLQQQGDAAGQLDWSAHVVDGTSIRAHQHAAGAAALGAQRLPRIQGTPRARRST